MRTSTFNRIAGVLENSWMLAARMEYGSQVPEGDVPPDAIAPSCEQLSVLQANVWVVNPLLDRRLSLPFVSRLKFTVASLYKRAVWPELRSWAVPRATISILEGISD